MLDKIHVASVFESGFTRILIYLDGSIEVIHFETTIQLAKETIDELITVRDREMLRKRVTE